MTWNVEMKVSSRRTAMGRALGVVAAAGLMASGLSGCGDSSNTIPTVYPVKGQILLSDGKPLTSGQVVLVSTKGREFSGKVESDGRFSIKTGAGDGAPEGEYLVRLDAEAPTAGVTWRSKKGAASLSFPAKYADETTSDLKVTVKPGENNLEPIKLLSGPAAAKSPSGKGLNQRD
jgi:hypothetical protein